jgi:copper chaperone CopZ
MQIDVFKVQPIEGAASAATLIAALKALAGMSTVEVSNPDGRTTVKYDNRQLSRSNIDTAVSAAGFRVVPPPSSCCGGCGG